MNNDAAPDPQRTVDFVTPEGASDASTNDETGAYHSAGNTNPAFSAPPADAPIIVGYRILSAIAKGGMGRVYAAHDLTLDREVAIKTLLPGANAERFTTEAKITARLPHPNIPPVHALGTLADGTPWLAMKLIRGRTLAAILKERSSPQQDLPRFIQIFEQIAHAVGFAHARGIIHRDLKPLNVMVGEFGEVQVMDWGLAKDLKSAEVVDADADLLGTAREAGVTQAGAIFGTPAYMPPEQARGEVVDERADVFAFGAMLMEVLTGERPWGSGPSAVVLGRAAHGLIQSAFETVAGCKADADLIAIARSCLQPTAAERYANSRELATVIAEYRARVEARLKQAETERAAEAAKAQELRKRRKLMRWSGATLAVVLLAGTGISLWQASVANEKADALAISEGETKKKAEALALSEAETKKKAEALELSEGEIKKKAEDLTIALGEKTKAEADAKAKSEDLAVQLKESRRLLDMSRLQSAQAAWDKNLAQVARDILNEIAPENRCVAWGLLARRFEGSEITLRGHSGEVTSVALSSDGRRVVTGSTDQTSRVWDVASGQMLVELKGHSGNVTNVALSSDGRRVVTGSQDKTARVWDVASGQMVVELKGHTDNVYSVALSSDGRRMVTMTVSEKWVWDIATGERVDEAIPRIAVGGNRLSDGRLVIAVGDRVLIFDPTVPLPPDEVARRRWFLRPDPAYHLEQRQLCLNEKNTYASQVHQSLEQQARGQVALEAWDFDKAQAHFLSALLLKPKPSPLPEVAPPPQKK